MKLVSKSSLQDFLLRKSKMQLDFKTYFLDLGFNIFQSIPVKDIPEDIYIFSADEKEKTMIILGSGGPLLWNKIPHKNSSDFIDNYTLDAFKIFKNAAILFPHKDIILPLQKLGRLTHFAHPSPIGLDISKEFGLWFSYRGVALIDEDIKTEAYLPYTPQCQECVSRECLSDLDLRLARLLCPCMIEQTYSKEQLDYHEQMLVKLKQSIS